MNLWIAGLMVLLLVGFAGASRLAAGSGGRARISSGRMKSMSRLEVEKMLERIAREDPPEESFGAMCYAVMAMPEVAEYTCPVCGEKTVYGSGQAEFVLRDLATARNIFEGIDARTGLDITLDESSFCSFCTPGTEFPALVLEVEYPDGRTHSQNVSVDDLRMLSGFFAGQLGYRTSNDGLLPLQPQIDRLRQLLGLEDGAE